MFKQDITTTYNLEDATYEIVIMLLVAFIFGFLLRYFSYKRATVVVQEDSNSSFSVQLSKIQKELEHSIDKNAEQKRTLALEYGLQIEDLKAKLTVARVDLEHCLASKDAILSRQSGQEKEEIKKSIHLEYIAQIDDLKSKLTVARVDLEHCLATKAAIPSHQDSSIRPIESAMPNDLKIIEGVGPALAKILNLADINTFEELATTSEDRLREILSNAGSRFKVHDPSTWPEQARLAANGNWNELKAYQEKLNS